MHQSTVVSSQYYSMMMMKMMMNCTCIFFFHRELINLVHMTSVNSACEQDDFTGQCYFVLSCVSTNCSYTSLSHDLWILKHALFQEVGWIRTKNWFCHAEFIIILCLMSTMGKVVKFCLTWVWSRNFTNRSLICAGLTNSGHNLQ